MSCWDWENDDVQNAFDDGYPQNIYPCVTYDGDILESRREAIEYCGSMDYKDNFWRGENLGFDWEDYITKYCWQRYGKYPDWHLDNITYHASTLTSLIVD